MKNILLLALFLSAFCAGAQTHPIYVPATNGTAYGSITLPGTIHWTLPHLTSSDGSFIGLSNGTNIIKSAYGWNTNGLYGYAAGLTNGSPSNFFGAGTIPVSKLARGTPDGTQFINDAGALAVPAGTGVTAATATNIAAAQPFILRSNILATALNLGVYPKGGTNTVFYSTDTTGNPPTLNTGVRYAQGTNAALDWGKGRLYNTSGGTGLTVDWQYQTLNDNGLRGGAHPVSTSLDWHDRQLIGLVGYTALDWMYRYLYDSSTNVVTDWDSKILFGGWTFYDSQTIGSATLSTGGKLVVSDGLTGNATISAGGQHLYLTAESGSGQTISVIGSLYLQITNAASLATDGDGQVIASLGRTITQTNFLLNTVYTSPRFASVRATATLTTAAVNGGAILNLLVDQAGGTSFTLLSQAHINTLITGLALTDDRDMTGFLNSGATYYWTNASTGAGNSAAIHAGTGQIMLY